MIFVKGLLEARPELEIETSNYLRLIESMEEEINKNKNEINDLKTKELDRISKEFLLHQYGRKFNVKLEDVISALIGEEQLYNEIERQNRKKKV